MIYVIARVWYGGKFEPIEAHEKEDDARFAASKLISLTSEPFNITIFTCKLIEKTQ